MEKSLKGTKTEANLWKAFAGESQARNKYTYYASKAKKEGYEQIAAIFQETADQEKEHAKMWFKYVHGIDGTAENLVDAAAGALKVAIANLVKASVPELGGATAIVYAVLLMAAAVVGTILVIRSRKKISAR